MTKEERAQSLIGEAVLRQLREKPDIRTWREIEPILRWADHWLSDEEKLLVAETTGLVLE